MSSPMIQATRKAQNLDRAVEAIKEAKGSTPYLDETLGEPLIADEAKIVAVLAEMAELIASQGRAIDHAGEHVVAGQDAETKRLRERVDKLEKAQPKPEPKSQPKSSRKK
jgi:hypothetical protein